MPERVQMRRTKGWRKPERVVVVARPSKWGNPHRVGSLIRCASAGHEWSRVMTRADAVSFFECALRAGLLPYSAAEVRASLAGRDLACWCPLNQPCHADVLLAVANGHVPST